MPRTRPTMADRTMTPIIATSIHPSGSHGTASERQDDGVEAGGLGLGQRHFGVLARSKGTDANADAAAGRGLRDLRVRLEAELLDLLARLPRRSCVGEGADLDDETLRLGGRGRAALKRQAGTLAL